MNNGRLEVLRLIRSIRATRLAREADADELRMPGALHRVALPRPVVARWNEQVGVRFPVRLGLAPPASQG